MDHKEKPPDPDEDRPLVPPDPSRTWAKPSAAAVTAPAQSPARRRGSMNWVFT